MVNEDEGGCQKGGNDQSLVPAKHRGEELRGPLRKFVSKIQGHLKGHERRDQFKFCGPAWRLLVVGGECGDS